VHGCHDMRCQRRFETFSAALRDPESAAKQRLRGGGAEANNDFGLEQGDLGIEPWPARGDFGRVWFFVDAAFSARFPFEVFDGIGDVGFVAIDAGLFECCIQQFAGGADERPPLAIFLIPGLFSDEKDSRLARAVAKDGLRGVFVEVAGLAIFGAIPGIVNGFGDRDGRFSRVF
jgi:hypothetical protein